MAANAVTVTVNDRAKTLRFGEALASGSVYQITIADRPTLAGSLVVLAERKLVAYCELTAGTGTVSLNTQEMGELMRHFPLGTVAQLAVVLHRTEAQAGENVAVGSVDVVSAGGAWTDDTTGALTLYKGERGESGPQGLKGDPGPKGDRGDMGPIGPKGERGPRGQQGERGDTGAEGPRGPKGERGQQGVIGPAGAYAIGYLQDRTSGKYRRIMSDVNFFGQPVVWLDDAIIDEDEITAFEMNLALSVFRNTRNIARIQNLITAAGVRD